MRIATWNINSVRIRLHLVEELVRTAAPDIVCLQETKAQESDFPDNALRDLSIALIPSAVAPLNPSTGVQTASPEICAG